LILIEFEGTFASLEEFGRFWEIFIAPSRRLLAWYQERERGVGRHHDCQE
jgi:hypothetical protein